MTLIGKLWIALGKAIRAGATEKQINNIAQRLQNARRS